MKLECSLFLTDCGCRTNSIALLRSCLTQKASAMTSNLINGFNGFLGFQLKVVRRTGFDFSS